MSEQKTFYQVFSIKDKGRPILIYECGEEETARAIALNESIDWRKGDNETYRLEVRRIKTKVVLDIIIKE